jgi:cytochrome c oxidase assembly factor CtaG/ferredoxin
VDSSINAIFASWPLNASSVLMLALAAIIFLRGWLRGRRVLQEEDDIVRLAAFFGGLAALFLAIDSPLDAFDALSLSAHMTQHILLMMVAPPLLLVARPVLPLLRGLPKTFVKEGLGPFLTARPLRAFFKCLVSPPVAFTLFAISSVGWHLPGPYEFALSSPFWHSFEHACFFWTGILFWWHVIQPGPGRSEWPRWTVIPYLVAGDIVNTAISASLVFSGKILYPSYAALQSSQLKPIEDQTLAGAIMWVPGSIIYLVPVVAIAVQMLSPRQSARRQSVVGRKKQPGSFSRRLPVVRRAAQFLMLIVAILVMADGFFGPQVTPMNLAGVLPWIHWRALSVFALLVIGNMFCMACPFTLVRDGARKFLPTRLRWPRQLRSKWMAAGLFALYLWSYEAFSLWNSPWLTAWIIAGYFSAAIVIDGVFRGASFCKYVCPIGQFHFVTSLVSPREVGVKRARVCQNCRTYDCIHGSTTARGCELYLFQPKKSGNLDCTFCMDCIAACPHGNVGLISISPAKSLAADPYRSSLGRLSKRNDITALVLVIVFGAFVNAAQMTAPIMAWEHGLQMRFGGQMLPLITAAFVAAGAIVTPLLTFFAAKGINRAVLSRPDTTPAARRFALALVPVGVSMWAAHLLYHFASGWDAAIPAVSRAILGSAVGVSMPMIPSWLAQAQLLLLDAGVLLSLYIIWRIARQYVERLRGAMGVAAPWWFISCLLYAAGVWIFLQPMQMRGVMH